MQNEDLNHFSGMDAAQLESAALEYAKSIKFAEAMKLWSQVLKLRPDYTQGYIRAINLCLEHRKYRQAEALCLEGINKCAGPNLTLYKDLAEVKTRQLKYAEALERWAEFRSLFPHAEEGYKKPAIIYRELGQYELADRICLEGMSNCGQDLGLYQLYAELAREGEGTEPGKLAELVRRRRELVAKFPNNIMELANWRTPVASCLHTDRNLRVNTMNWQLPYCEDTMAKKWLMPVLQEKTDPNYVFMV